MKQRYSLASGRFAGFVYVIRFEHQLGQSIRHERVEAKAYSSFCSCDRVVESEAIGPSGACGPNNGNEPRR
jgi:hypothetical protein